MKYLIIKEVKGELTEPLTLGKHYPVSEELPLDTYVIKDDVGDNMVILLDNCDFLNGGSWTLVETEELDHTER